MNQDAATLRVAGPEKSPWQMGGAFPAPPSPRQEPDVSARATTRNAAWISSSLVAEA